VNILELPWLPKVPESFRLDLQALRRAPTIGFGDVRKLSTLALNLSQLSTLARACASVDKTSCDPNRQLRLRLLSHGTVDLIATALVATAPRHGLLVEASVAQFGSWMQEALDPRSATHQAAPDAVLLCLDHRAFELSPCLDDNAQAEAKVQAALAQITTACAALQQSRQCTVIFQTIPAPAADLLGHMDTQVPGTTRAMVERLNALLRQHRAPGQLLLDAAHLAAQAGSSRWQDTALWATGKIPLSAEATPLYADHVCRLLMAQRGYSKKCLVLDLDNTLWGGVIGDDGMAGIVLGQGSAVGEAHVAVQAAALALRTRGVVLAVCSKNDDSIARQAVREHPEMLLREEHFAAFQANWQDKASNLRAIAKGLNIGVDALVFLDDNPVERNQVRFELPEVAVPEVPNDATQFAPLLLAGGYFESVQFTAEDLARAEQYQANAMRSLQLGAAGDLKSYLQSLDMVAHFAPFDAVGRARITQLINKTNQFNLTTRRRTEQEVAELEHHAPLTLQIRLKDRYGDNGMICVVICSAQDPHTWLIDTWLMSCRVLKRELERAVLDVVAAQAKRQGVQRLLGQYLPTEKNALVKDHYLDLGFSSEGGVRGAAEGATLWALDLRQHQAAQGPMQFELNRLG
jgi:FkbH-like protein